MAQTTRITGTVTDASTGEAIPFANISFIDSRVSTNSDFDGHYVLDTYYATDSIRAVSVGYEPFQAKVKRDAQQVIDIRLKPMTAQLENVVITYTGNPAFPILRRLVANKPVNNREKLAAYEYEAYNKVEFDLNNITEDFKQKKLFKDFAFIFDHVDTTGGKAFLPIFMTETLSEVYYRQQPRTRREVVRGTKVSGLENTSISQFMGDMYQNVNIYDNFLVIFGKNFVSPIADGGRAYYHYYLLDSNWVGNNWCYQISFQPKRVQELAFTGTMWVNDTSYAVKHIEATIATGANLNFVQGLHVGQGRAAALGQGVEHPVTRRLGLEVTGDVVQHQHEARQGLGGLLWRTGRRTHGRHLYPEELARRGGRHELRRRLRCPAQDALLDVLQRMRDQLAVKHAVDGSPQTNDLRATGHARCLGQGHELQTGTVVVEEDATVQVADHHALGQLGHQCRQPTALLLDPAGHLGDPFIHFPAQGFALLDQLIEQPGQLARLDVALERKRPHHVRAQHHLGLLGQLDGWRHPMVKPSLEPPGDGRHARAPGQENQHQPIPHE